MPSMNYHGPYLAYRCIDIVEYRRWCAVRAIPAAGYFQAVTEFRLDSIRGHFSAPLRLQVEVPTYIYKWVAIIPKSPFNFLISMQHNIVESTQQ